MFNLRTLATIGVAIVLGLVAIVFVNNYFGKKAPPKATPSAAVPVVVAAAPIVRGSNILPAMLKVITLPPEQVPAGAFSDPAQVGGVGSLSRVAFRDLSINDPVLRTDVSAPGGRLTLATTLKPGMVAVSIRSNEVAGVAGFVLPGEHIDVLLTRSLGTGGEGQGHWVTQILAEDIKVLGVDQIDDERTDKPTVARAVTVEVTPTQAQAIALAQSAGSISLSLREDGDHSLASRRSTTVDDLAVGPRPTVQRIRNLGATIRVTRGTTTTDYQMGAR